MNKKKLTYINYGSESNLLKIENIVREYENSQQLTVNTSGSTGPVKKYVFDQDQIRYSVDQTLQYFNLKKGDKVLFSLSTDYVAGKMMVLRALLGQLNLIITEPIKNPYQAYNITEYIDFAPLVPLQVQSILNKSPEYLKKIGKVLIGGAEISNDLKNELIKNNINAYQSFGMAETLTHFALKKITDEMYECIGDTTVQTDKENRLIINNQLLTGTPSLQTNDVVEISSSKKFKWIGRYDNVINSAGHKINPETAEHIIQNNQFPFPLFIYGVPDKKWGEKVVISVEGSESELIDFDFTPYFNDVHPYSIPKEIYYNPSFTRTSSQKIKRKDSFQSSSFLKKV